MGTNGFREDELITKRVNGQVKIFPVVAGRLRLAHTENKSLSLQTEMVSWDGQYAVFKCCAVTGKGQFIGYGTANSQRDARLAESLVELAETRSIARALRWAGFGMEYCSAEEITHMIDLESPGKQKQGKLPPKAFPDGNPEGKPESKPQSCGIGKATQAQVRALYALARKTELPETEKKYLLDPLNATAFEDLSREDASRLISHLQTQAA